MKKVLILLFFLLFSISSLAKTYEIIPGYGIDGVIYTGNTKQQVLKSWGEPTMIISLEEFLGSGAKNWKAYLYPKYSINLVFNEEDKIILIFSKSELYSTPEGIKIGSPLNNVISTYGNNYFREPSNDKDYDYKIKYEKAGFEFHIKNEAVFEIGISYR